MPNTPDEAPANRADLCDAIERMGARIDASFERLMGRIDFSFEHLAACLDRTEKTVVSEFHRWTNPAEMRLRSQCAALRDVDAQEEAAGDALRSMVERIAVLERKAEGRQPPSPHQ